MDNIIDLIATDSAPSVIATEIKGQLYTKSAGKIDQIRPYVANSMFGVEESEEEENFSETDDEVQDQEEE